MSKQMSPRPTAAFVAASWVALIVGMATFLFGIWSAAMPLNEKGYYFTLLMYGLFSAVSLQKTVRDRLEGVKVTDIYFKLCWFSLVLAILLLTVGLFYASIANVEKGFYAMAFLLSLFAAVAVQKNVRDIGAANEADRSLSMLKE